MNPECWEIRTVCREAGHAEYFAEAEHSCSERGSIRLSFADEACLWINFTSLANGQPGMARMTWGKLLDEGALPGKGIKMIWRGFQVGIVLLFFFGVFVVIGANWMADRITGKPSRKRAETGNA